MRLAQGLTGKIQSPTGSVATGLPTLITNLITLAVSVGGILVLVNFILAGYDFLTASGDPKKVTNAVTRMWQSVLGLIIVVGSLALVSIIGKIFGINNILTPVVSGPGSL